MAIAPAKRKRQQIFIVLLTVVLILIGGAWFWAFRAFPGGGVGRPSPAEEPGPAIKDLPSGEGISKIDWEFLSSFENRKIFVTFPESVSTQGRTNPFLSQ